jgi:hypothetical protein
MHPNPHPYIATLNSEALPVRFDKRTFGWRSGVPKPADFTGHGFRNAKSGQNKEVQSVVSSASNARKRGDCAISQSGSFHV